MAPSLKRFELVGTRTEWQRGYFVDRQKITFSNDREPRTRVVVAVECRTLDELEAEMQALAPTMWELIRDGFPEDGPAPGVKVRPRMPDGARKPAGFDRRIGEGRRYLPDGSPITHLNCEQAVATPAQEVARG